MAFRLFCAGQIGRHQSADKSEGHSENSKIFWLYTTVKDPRTLEYRRPHFSSIQNNFETQWSAMSSFSQLGCHFFGPFVVVSLNSRFILLKYFCLLIIPCVQKLGPKPCSFYRRILWNRHESDPGQELNQRQTKSLGYS